MTLLLIFLMSPLSAYVVPLMKSMMRFATLFSVFSKFSTTGFFFGKPNEEAQIYDSNTYVRNYTYLGKIAAVDAEGFAHFEQKNKFSVGDRVERMRFDGSNELLTVLEIRNHEGLSVESAPHPKEALAVRFSAVPVVGELLRTETAK